jgi:hypothetical protein
VHKRRRFERQVIQHLRDRLRRILEIARLFGNDLLKSVWVCNEEGVQEHVGRLRLDAIGRKNVRGKVTTIMGDDDLRADMDSRSTNMAILRMIGHQRDMRFLSLHQRIRQRPLHIRASPP